MNSERRFYRVKSGLDTLCLSFRPLFALRIALRECDVFFFGTASTHGGNNSRREEGNDGRVQVDGERREPAPVRKVGKSAAVAVINEPVG